MHFLFTAPRYHTNQRFAVKALLDAGHHVSFVALRRQHSEVYDELEPLVLGETQVTPWLRGSRWTWPPPLQLRNRLRRLNPDVVVVREPYTAFGFLAVALGKMSRARVVFYSQLPMHRQIPPRKRIVSSLTTGLAGAKHITPVLGSPDRHSPAFGSLRYVPFVMESQTPPQKREWFQGNTTNVMSVGKFQSRKGHAMFLEVIARIRERHSIRATIIGENTTEEHEHEFARVKELQAELGLGNTVRIRTNITYHEVQREYAAHDLFVLPSSREPAAVSHLEAMSHSLPVICSDSNGTQCYIRQGENGYVFRTGNAQDLEERIESVIANRTRLVEMGERSHELVLTEHSPSKYVETMEALARGES